jgi:tetratricopeptide (TPR) repeat protein
MAAAIITLGGWLIRDKLGWFRPRQDTAVDERIRSEVSRQLGELQKQSAAPPPGTALVDTESLANAATQRTQRLLAEAVELQRQHKEREAIDCLLEAYRRDLPPIAKAQLHILAGNGFLNLSELEEAEGHYRQALTSAEQSQNRRLRPPP